METKPVFAYESVIRTLSIVIGMSLVACGFLTFAWMLDVLASALVPVLDRLTLAEIEWKCELQETDPMWAYDGGYEDCISWHTSEFKQLFIKLIGVAVGALATFKFLCGGLLLLYFADKPNAQ